MQVILVKASDKCKFMMMMMHCGLLKFYIEIFPTELLILCKIRSYFYIYIIAFGSFFYLKRLIL